jgi:hypothetical protein
MTTCESAIKIASNSECIKAINSNTKVFFTDNTHYKKCKLSIKENNLCWRHLKLSSDKIILLSTLSQNDDFIEKNIDDFETTAKKTTRKSNKKTHINESKGSDEQSKPVTFNRIINVNCISNLNKSNEDNTTENNIQVSIEESKDNTTENSVQVSGVQVSVEESKDNTTENSIQGGVEESKGDNIDEDIELNHYAISQLESNNNHEVEYVSSSDSEDDTVYKTKVLRTKNSLNKNADVEVYLSIDVDPDTHEYTSNIFMQKENSKYYKYMGVLTQIKSSKKIPANTDLNTIDFYIMESSRKYSAIEKDAEVTVNNKTITETRYYIVTNNYEENFVRYIHCAITDYIFEINGHKLKKVGILEYKPRTDEPFINFSFKKKSSSKKSD